MELVMLTANLLVVFALELGTTTLILAVLRLRLFVGEIKMTLTCRRAWILQLRSRLWELHQRCNLRVQPSTIWNMSIRFLKKHMEHVHQVFKKTYGTCPSSLKQDKNHIWNMSIRFKTKQKAYMEHVQMVV